jgi:hypothetical protein
MDLSRLRAAVDAVVPGAGALRYWEGLAESDRVAAVLDLLDGHSPDELADDPGYLWFADTVSAGFYADPAS